jgi:hypothetical protein
MDAFQSSVELLLDKATFFVLEHQEEFQSGVVHLHLNPELGYQEDLTSSSGSCLHELALGYRIHICAYRTEGDNFVCRVASRSVLFGAVGQLRTKVSVLSGLEACRTFDGHSFFGVSDQWISHI